MTAKTTNKDFATSVREATKRYALIRPHVSEKASVLSENGFYVFRIEKKANKNEVKKEVETKYKVTVEEVRVISVPSKKRRTGRTVGKRSGYKKAIVKLKKGQTIDLTTL
jgi:large subunit ribosomal protein L23